MGGGLDTSFHLVEDPFAVRDHVGQFGRPFQDREEGPERDSRGSVNPRRWALVAERGKLAVQHVYKRDRKVDDWLQKWSRQ